MQRLPVASPSSTLPSASTSTGLMPGSGRVAEPGFKGVAPGSGRDEDPAGLGLPPGVDDGAAPVAHHIVIPEPGLGIDRLAHRAQQAQRRALGALHRPIALAHQRADRRGRGIEDVDLVLVDDLPEARAVGIVRHALEHQRGGAVGQRPIDDVAMSGHPADIGGAPVDIALVIIEDVLMGPGDIGRDSRRWYAARPWVSRSSRRCRE